MRDFWRKYNKREVIIMAQGKSGGKKNSGIVKIIKRIIGRK